MKKRRKLSEIYRDMDEINKRGTTTTNKEPFVSNPSKEYIQDNEKRISEINYDAALCKIFVSMGGTVLRDGNMYGAVIGDLVTGCAGFEKTRMAAIQTCIHNFYNEKAKSLNKIQEEIK